MKPTKDRFYTANNIYKTYKEITPLPHTVCVLIGFILGFIGVFIALRIEQTAGYYECAKCGHRYVPTYNKVLWAMHINRTRHMKCPECGYRSWNKKVISKRRK